MNTAVVRQYTFSLFARLLTALRTHLKERLGKIFIAHNQNRSHWRLLVVNVLDKVRRSL